MSTQGNRGWEHEPVPPGHGGPRNLADLAALRLRLLGLDLDEASDLVALAGWSVQAIRPGPIGTRVVYSSEGRYDRIRVRLDGGLITEVHFG